MWHTVEQPPDVAGEIGVPGVRVQQIHACGVAHHLKIDPEGLKRGIGASEIRGHGMCLRVWSRRAEAVHVDVDEWSQMGGQLTHVDARAPVDIGRPFAGEEADLHGCSVGPALSDPEV